ncbi:UDP-glycosyltransferase 72B1-like isoform X1 [Punica granatum]|uniref:Glycosyltransferase n=3 Tax=Punica granatum TaxID=22663 RepID=A0A6P8E8Y4_PUNGR|nr:UDP-glycosyltransferase 72B1-like isoform X1 [Punica granatum]
MVSDNPKQAVDVAVLVSPGIGHTIPLFEFSKRLSVDHGLEVCFLVITTNEPSPAQDSLLRPEAGAVIPPNLHVVDLPPTDLSTIPEDTTLGDRISLLVKRSLESVRVVLLEPTSRPKALVIDIFCSEALEFGQELSIPVYTFFTTCAALLTFSLYLPTLDHEVEGEFTDMPGPIRVPGCRSYRPEDLLDPVKNRKIEEYRWILLHFSRLPRAAGILLNTWEDLEPVSLAALKENPFFLQIPAPPVYTIGPVIKQAEGSEMLTPSNAESLTWLDRRPPESVLFITFGSGGTLTIEQLTELGWGLELSQQRFVWVVRAPTDVSGSGTFFKAGSTKSGPEEYLPEGFLERTRGLGVVVQSWAPQMAILGHSSTGAFISHCGWNSTLESLSCGVPLIAWPLYAEQRMNAAMLAEDIGVAIRPVTMDQGTGLVGRDEVERVVRMVMEGEEGKALRRRARDLKDSAEKALSCGGTSWETLATVCREWKSKDIYAAPNNKCSCAAAGRT